MIQLSDPYITTRNTIALTAAAKLLQSCLTLCNPIDGSLPGSPVAGILQARTLEWVVISFSIALTRQTFVGKVMSLLFNMLSGLVIAFLLRSKHLLISWLQSLSSVILEPKEIKSVNVSTISPSMCHEVMGPDAQIFVFLNVEF